MYLCSSVGLLSFSLNSPMPISLNFLDPNIKGYTYSSHISAGLYWTLHVASWQHPALCEHPFLRFSTRHKKSSMHSTTKTSTCSPGKLFYSSCTFYQEKDEFTISITSLIFTTDQGPFYTGQSCPGGKTSANYHSLRSYSPKAAVSTQLRCGPDDTWGGGYGFFFSEQTFFLLPNKKQTFFSSQAKEHAIFPPHIAPFFCQICEQTFTFYSLLRKLFFITFRWIISPPHNPLPPRIIWSAPNTVVW